MGMTDMLRRTAIEFGEARGEARGIEKEKLATARKSIGKGLDDAFIADITGLSVAQVAAIREEMA